MGGGQARSSEEAANSRRAKGPEFKRNDQRRDRQGIGKRLSTPDKVWELRQSLHAKDSMNSLSESRMRENRSRTLSGLMSGNVETEHG